MTTFISIPPGIFFTWKEELGGMGQLFQKIGRDRCIALESSLEESFEFEVDLNSSLNEVAIISFADLPEYKQKEVQDLVKSGNLEVRCPWWPPGHWQKKDAGQCIPEAYYRITE